MKSEKFQVEVIEDKTFTLGSTDNKPYDVLFNPENLTRSNFSKAFRVRFYGNNSEKNIVLIGSFYSHDTECAVLDDNKLTILMYNTVTVIDIEECKILRHEKFSDFGNYFSIYKFQDGYIIHGELEIVKLDKYLNKEWDFSGADIFVTQDKNKAFEINGDNIQFYDWNGVYYELDMNGKLIYDTYKKYKLIK